MVNYGIWKTDNKSNSYHTMSICRHHGLQEFGISIGNRNGHNHITQHCLLCSRLSYVGRKTGHIPGCANYTGIYIAEKVLSKAFDVMEKTHPHASYDFICGKGLKIDSKCAVLSKSGNKFYWQFFINKNKIPDIFCLIALDNTSSDIFNDPTPKYVWLINGTDIINGQPLNEKMKLSITPNKINKFYIYRRTDMEGKIIKCCDKLK